MTVMDLLVTFLCFSDLPDSQRDAFLRQHPKILNPSVIDSMLMSAQLRELESQRRVGSAALYISTRLNDAQRQANARRVMGGQRMQTTGRFTHLAQVQLIKSE